jgi:hypothetical protein
MTEDEFTDSLAGHIEDALSQGLFLPASCRAKPNIKIEWRVIFWEDNGAPQTHRHQSEAPCDLQ